MTPPDESAKEALAETTDLEASLGRIGRKQPHMEPFITAPIFAVAKKKDGAPKRDARGRLKYRQAHHHETRFAPPVRQRKVGRYQCRDQVRDGTKR